MAHVNTCTPAAAERMYRVQIADTDHDRENILRLCKTSALQSSPEKYLWNYETNPLGRAWCALVIEPLHQQAVGTTALFPRRLLLDGVSLQAAVAGDLAVESEHRTLHPAMPLQTAAIGACCDGMFDVVYGFPNDAARSVQLRAGYNSVGQTCAGVRLLRTGAAFRQSGRRLWNLGASIFNSTITMVSKAARSQTSVGYSYVPLSRFDERFNRFWRRSLLEHRIIIQRDSRYANWRFLECPMRKYSLFAAQHETSGEIGGYLVWSPSHDGKIHISDVMADDDVFDDLLTAFIREQQNQDAYCVTIVYFGDSKLIRKLHRLGFIFRSTRSEVLLSINPQLPKPERLLDPDNWYLLDGDSDS